MVQVAAATDPQAVMPWLGMRPVARAGSRTRGAVAYLNGLAAEERVIGRYREQGALLLHRRWRCAAGEIDLIFALGDLVVFVEVKASRDLAQAVTRLGAGQAARILRAAEVFLATTAAPWQSARIDLALVAHGSGQGSGTEILPDVLWQDGIAA
ncbi:YraN family protein [Frigidibacter sp. MR17.14]|uniref:YraN family protein n=1 Tax=Frigidibacter sp. MR17.14 TaxID=3126509 RepID=UPI003012A55F